MSTTVQLAIAFTAGQSFLFALYFKAENFNMFLFNTLVFSASVATLWVYT